MQCEEPSVGAAVGADGTAVGDGTLLLVAAEQGLIILSVLASGLGTMVINVGGGSPR